MQKTYLFQSPAIAEEIAVAMRGKWDGCSAVTFTAKVDQAAFKTAMQLAGAEEYCQQGDICKYESWESYGRPGRIPPRYGAIIFEAGQQIAFDCDGNLELISHTIPVKLINRPDLKHPQGASR
jgi:hypothetical protein